MRHEVYMAYCLGACCLWGGLSPGHVVSRGRLSPGKVVSGADSLRGRLSQDILSTGQIVSGADCFRAPCPSTDIVDVEFGVMVGGGGGVRSFSCQTQLLLCKVELS